ncbi:MAG: hypothetical protein ACT4OP_10510 [Actinomycetota bacterium]
MRRAGRVRLLLAVLLGLQAGCGSGSAQPDVTTATTRPEPVATTISVITTTAAELSDDQLVEIDLSAALLTVEDLPAGARTSIEDVDYLASGVPRIILCGDDVRRELDALTGRFSLFYGPEGVFLWLSPAVSALPGDTARLLVNRLTDVAETCDRTWQGEGYEGADTDFEVLSLYDPGEVSDQRLAIEMAHRSA